jgi:hypothetical protein
MEKENINKEKGKGNKREKWRIGPLSTYLAHGTIACAWPSSGARRRRVGPGCQPRRSVAQAAPWTFLCGDGPTGRPVLARMVSVPLAGGPSLSAFVITCTNSTFTVLRARRVRVFFPDESRTPL